MKNSIYEGLKAYRKEKHVNSNSYSSIVISSNSGHNDVILRVPSYEVVIIEDYSLMYIHVIFLEWGWEIFAITDV